MLGTYPHFTASISAQEDDSLQNQCESQLITSPLNHSTCGSEHNDGHVVTLNRSIIYTKSINGICSMLY